MGVSAMAGSPEGDPLQAKKAVIQQIRAKQGYGTDLSTDMQAIWAEGQSVERRYMHFFKKEIYSGRHRCVYELIQNADDNQYSAGCVPTLRFDVRDNAIIISNNEVGFSDDDVRSICDINRSTKCHNVEKTGEKGIGFKSVFTCAKVVYIASNGYSFKLDEGAPRRPDWVDHFPAEISPVGTTIVLELREGGDWLPELLQNPEDAEPDVMLFLRQLQSIEVISTRGRFTWTLEGTRQRDGCTKVVKIKEIHGTLQPTKTVTTVRMASLAVTPPSEALAEPARQHVRGTRVQLGFPVDEEGAPVSASGRALFATLPVMPTHFRFFAQGDFLLSASRETVIEASPWNEWLARMLADAFLVAFGTLFSRDEGLRTSFFAYLPRETDGNHHAVLAPVVAHLYELLKAEPCIYTRGHTWSKPCLTILADDGVARLFPNAWAQRALGMDLVSGDVDLVVHMSTLMRLGCRRWSLEDVKLCLSNESLLRDQQPQWFHDLFVYLGNEFPDCFVDGEVAAAKIVPLVRGDRRPLRIDSAAPIFLPIDASVEDLATFACSFDAPILLSTVLPASQPLRQWLLDVGCKRATWLNVVEHCVLPANASAISHCRSLALVARMAIYLRDAVAGDEKTAVVDACRRGLLLRKEGGCHKSQYALPSELYHGTRQMRTLFADAEAILFLHRQYETMEGFEEFLLHLDILSRPRLEQRCSSTRNKKELEDKYGIWGLPKNSNYTLALASLPNALLVRAASDPDVAAVLIEVLDEHWNAYCRELSVTVTAQAQWAPFRVELPAKEFLKDLLDLKVTTTSGKVMPIRSCSLPSGSAEQFFGNSLTYLPWKLHCYPFAEALGLSGELSLPVLVTWLRNARSAKPNLKDIVRVYKAIEGLAGCGGAKSRSLFESEPFIFARIHGDSAASDWFRSKEVVWSDEDDGKEGKDMYGPALQFLDETYDESLKSFFIQTCFVFEWPDFTHVVALIRNLTAWKNHGNYDVKGLRRCYVALSRKIKKLTAKTGSRAQRQPWWHRYMDMLEELRHDRVFLLRTGDLASSTDVFFAPDDEGVFEALKHDASMHDALLDIEPEAFVDLHSLVDFFAIKPLSDVAALTLACDLNAVEVDEHRTRRVHDAFIYFARCVYHFMSENWCGVKEVSAAYEHWATWAVRLKCCTVPKLRLQVSMLGDRKGRCEHEPIYMDRAIHVDAERYIIFLDRELCNDDDQIRLSKAMVEVLAGRHLSKAQRLEVESVSVCLLGDETLRKGMFTSGPMKHYNDMPRRLRMQLARVPHAAQVSGPAARPASKARPKAKTRPKLSATLLRRAEVAATAARPPDADAERAAAADGSGAAAGSAFAPSESASPPSGWATAAVPAKVAGHIPPQTRPQPRPRPSASPPTGWATAAPPTGSATTAMPAHVAGHVPPQLRLQPRRRPPPSRPTSPVTPEVPGAATHANAVPSVGQVGPMQKARPAAPAWARSERSGSRSRSRTPQRAMPLPAPPLPRPETAPPLALPPPPLPAPIRAAALAPRADPGCARRELSPLRRPWSTQVAGLPASSGHLIARASTSARASDGMEPWRHNSSMQPEPVMPRTGERAVSGSCAALLRPAALPLPPWVAAGSAASSRRKQMEQASSRTAAHSDDGSLQDSHGGRCAKLKARLWHGAPLIRRRVRQRHSRVQEHQHIQYSWQQHQVQQNPTTVCVGDEPVWRRIYLQNGGQEVIYGRGVSQDEERLLVDVSDVYFTHGRISSTFCGGSHKGQPVSSMVEALERGDVAVGHPNFELVCARFDGRLHSLNNRRLHALKEYQKRCSEPVKVHVRIPKKLCPFTVKFMDAYTTQDDGRSVRFR